MENCSFCQTLTEIEIGGAPICLKCSDGFDEREGHSRVILDCTPGVRDALPMVRHSLLGSPSCWGYLIAKTTGGSARIFCNECEAVILSGVLPEDIGAAVQMLRDQSIP